MHAVRPELRRSVEITDRTGPDRILLASTGTGPDRYLCVMDRSGPDRAGQTDFLCCHSKTKSVGI